mmetsp:Transcript_43854/g.83747  ORF Transcript_43854/g.83747 Transcript_43854/m.83747 type:complete len:261 (-) Transcript_43854:392-1174(-)
MELLIKCTHSPLYFLLEKHLIQKRGLAVVAHLGGHIAQVLIWFQSTPHLIDVVARRQRQLPLRIQDTKGGEQLASVIARELCPNRVYGDIHRASVSFKRQHLTHELGRSAPKGCTELSKVFQVSLVKGVAHDLDVHLVQILARQALGKVSCQRRIDEHILVQLTHVLCYCQGSDGVKDAQRVTVVQQFLHVALVQRARDNQHHIVDHVPVREVVQEGGQRLGRLATHVAELVHQLASCLVHNGRHLERAWFILKETAVIS